MNFVNQTFIIAMMMMMTFVKVNGKDPWIVDISTDCQTLCLNEEDADPDADPWKFGGEYDVLNLILTSVTDTANKPNLNLTAKMCPMGVMCITNDLDGKAFQQLDDVLYGNEKFAKRVGWCGDTLQRKCVQEANDLANTGSLAPTASGKVQTGSRPAPTAKPASDASTLYPALIGLLSSMLAFILFVR